MALSEGFQRYLGALGGGGPVAPLAQGLVTGLGSYAEQQKKKREEEKAREREGLTFALNQAIEAGDEEGIKRLGPQVYGGVDFGAVASAAAKNRAEKDRTKDQTRLDSLLSGLQYVSDQEARNRLGTEAGVIQARLLGVPATVERGSGEMIPSGRMRTVPGRSAYSAGQVIPVAEAQGLAAAGLGGSLAATGSPDTRMVKTAIPAAPDTQVPEMVERMESVPNFVFGRKLEATTPLIRARLSGISAQQSRLEKEVGKAFDSIPVESRTKFRKEKDALIGNIREVARLAADNDGVMPEGVDWPVIGFSQETKTTKEVTEDLRMSLLRSRIKQSDVSAALAKVRIDAIPRDLQIKARRAEAAMISAGASRQNAATAAEALAVRKDDTASRRRFEIWKSKEVNRRKLADIDNRADAESEKQTEIMYPKKDIERLPQSERPEAIKARDAYRAGLKRTYLTRDVIKALDKDPPEAISTEPQVRKVGGPAAPAKPAPAPQRRPAPATGGGGGAFNGLPGARQ